MPQTCTITGSFTRRGEPIQGQLIRFTPSRLWVIQEHIAWACLAPADYLDHEGRFSVEVTPTDSDAITWHYLVETPAGAFKFYVPWTETTRSLKELIHEYRPGPRPAY